MVLSSCFLMMIFSSCVICLFAVFCAMRSTTSSFLTVKVSRSLVYSTSPSVVMIFSSVNENVVPLTVARLFPALME